MTGTELLVEVIVAELAREMRSAYLVASKLETFPIAVLQRRPDNSAQMDAMMLVLTKAKELREALDGVTEIGAAMLKRAEAVAETGKEAVPA